MARKLALILFLANINCIFLDGETIPAHLERRVCVNPARESESKIHVTPTRRLEPHEYPFFTDDLDFENMELVIARQLERFRERDLSGFIVFGQDTYELTALVESLSRFQDLMREARVCLQGKERREECFLKLDEAIRRTFYIYGPDLGPGDPRFGELEPTLFTGYYTPSLWVSPRPTPDFPYPIYRKPQDEWYARTGRYLIDFRQQFIGLDLELFFAADRFDLYLLQVEGGGRAWYHDSEGRLQSTYLSYGGSNGRQWRFLSTQMLDKNWIAEPDIPSQRDFISRHPAMAGEIFSFCPGYVFFKTSSEPPVGSDEVPLTDNRSIATDSKNYSFKGLLAFVRTKRPSPDRSAEMIPFSRFVLDQDTGGAIHGKARVDFYFGEGHYAELAANTLKQRGDLFYLMLKPSLDSN